MTGFTEAERYLARLAKRSFLSLWSHQNLFRDEFDSKSGSREGKEVCDLAVIFGNHVLLFSDKDCKYKETQDPKVGWRRWYKRAIESSARQLYGAERWIGDFPKRVFLDSACEISFPIDIPNSEEIVFHRIAVVHSISDACRRYFGGGSGSLIFNSCIQDSQHIDENCLPFYVGIIDSTKGHVHVLDDTTLDILMRYLDTPADFIAYLEKKERLISNVNIASAGEEELLAVYLSNLNSDGEHDFDFPKEADLVALDESHWNAYITNPQAQEKLEADKVSYLWDELIEEFSKHIIAGTQHFTTHPEIRDSEVGMRMMARTSRFERRGLSEALLDFFSKAQGQFKAARYLISPQYGDTAYVFLLLKYLPEKPYEEYRIVRRNALELYLNGLKLRYPQLEHIVGMAFDSDIGQGGSEDFMYLDARNWDSSGDEQLEKTLKELNILQSDPSKNITRLHRQEYPELVRQRIPMKNKDANKPCPCGSGKKFKKCCGRRTMP